MARLYTVAIAGPLALTMLRSDAPGEVLSSHATALYCRLDEKILLLHSAAMGLIPFGLGYVEQATISGVIEPDSEGWKSIPAGALVTNDANAKILRTPGMTFDYARSATPLRCFPWNTATPDIEQFGRGLAVAGQILDSGCCRGVAASFFPRFNALCNSKPLAQPFADIWQDALWQPLHNLILYCLHGDTAKKDPAGLLRALIGLGSGLTPLADDVLCGFFATSHILAPLVPSRRFSRIHDILSPAALSCLQGATTPQSAAFLASAVSGWGFGLLDELVAAVYTAGAGNAPALRDTLTKLSGIGDTSGSALVLGSLLAIQMASSPA